MSKDAWFLEEEEDADDKDGRRGAAGRRQDPSQQQQQQAQRLNDESSASLKRSLAIAHQTNAVAADTMVELDKQGRQIENMERDMELIEDNNRQADRHLRGLKTIFGSIANKFSKNKSFRDESQVQPRQTPETVRNQQVASRSAPTAASSHGAAGAPSYDGLSGNDPETQRMRQQVAEQDRDLDELSGALGQMMNIATDMNREITDQNRRLEGVSNKVDESNRHIEKNNRQVKRML